MATQNLGPNSLQQQEHQQQLKHTPPTSVNDTSWHTSANNDNPNDARQSMTGAGLGANVSTSINNNNNNNNVDKDTNQKIPHSDNALTSANRPFNRVAHLQPNPQSQQYHGIFSPQIPASLQSSLASRVDQIIRTTLHDSPAYTPPTSKNSNTAANNNSSGGNGSGLPNSSSNSNMPSPSSSSLIFNPAPNMIGANVSSAPPNSLGHPPNSSGGPISSTGSPLTSIYGLSSLSAIGDMSTNNGASSGNPQAKTSAHSSASHSALAAAAALQSLNQSHVQRSQQQLAHTQHAPFLNAAPLATIKPPSNGSGTPIPQAAHGGNSSAGNHMPKSSIATSIANADQIKHSALANDSAGDFTSRMQPNNASNTSNNKVPPSALTHLPGNWREQHTSNPNGTIPRIIGAHSGGSALPPFTSSSSPYALINAHMPMGLNTGNSNSMISQDGDSLSRLNALRNSSGNPSQLHDDKGFPPNFANSLVKQGAPFDNMRGPQASGGSNEPRASHLTPAGLDAQERITEEKLAIFAYNLFSTAPPGTNRCKRIIYLDNEMRDSIQNGDFYTKYDHIATGILTNMILVPNFSIIDYLRRDRFSFQEVERIERVNRKLSPSNFACLMELVRQRPFIPTANKPPPPSGMEISRPPFCDSLPMGINPNMGAQHDNMLGVPQGGFMRGNNQMMSSSPGRNELGTMQGIDKSRCSSQSPSDISRSQAGSNFNKFLHAQNQFSSGHQNLTLGSTMDNNQYGPPSYSVNQQKNHQQHTSPQTSRSSPFQQPISACQQVMARPPRSHSTIGGLNIGQFNAPFDPSPVRQPPAAHQSSSRPNLAALASEGLPAHAHPTAAPITAHMSSKTPQTPRLPDSVLSIHSIPPQVPTPCAGSLTGTPLPGRDPMLSSHPDYLSQPGRQESDTTQGLPIQSLYTLRQQEMNSRESASKRSLTPQYPPSGMPNMMSMGSMSTMDMNRQGFIDNQHTPMQSHTSTQFNQNNNPLGVASIAGQRTSNFPHVGPGSQANTNMPPPAASSGDYQRGNPNEMSIRVANPSNASGSNMTVDESQLNQYNSLMAAYQQQQIMLSNKLIDNGPGALPPSNMTSRASAQNISLNQSASSRPAVNEPMLVDTLNTRQPLSQSNSPKTATQRSIITGSASSGSKRSKKTKLSPNTANQALTDKTPVVNRDDAISPNEKPSIAADLSGSAFKTESTAVKAEGELQVGATLAGDLHAAGVQSETQASHCMSDRTLQAGLGPTRVEAATISTVQENSENTNKLKLGHLSSPSSLPNISDQSISGRKSLDDSSLLDCEAKTSCSNDISLQNNIPNQPSKYQKIFTKKAWLKNYDEEDQARLTEQSSLNTSDKAAVKSDLIKAGSAPQSPLDESNSKSPTPVTKPNGSKNSKSSKSDAKKKLKQVKSKKANSIEAVRSNRPAKAVDNDSEGTTASTSDMDDTDETDSMKSAGDKKLRRMPKRKVKSNPDREPSDQLNKDVKLKTNKDPKDKDIARKRGKKEKPAAESLNVKRKYNSDDESLKQKSKKIKEEDTDKTISASPKGKKRIGDRFLQTQPCYEIVPKAIRCLECRRVRQSSLKSDKAAQSKQASKANWDDFCRFFEFRKLRYNKAGQIVVAGFSDSTDAKDSDKQIWLPSVDEIPTNITYKVAKFILENIGDEFCNLVLQERSVIERYEAKSGDKRTTWKRAVNGLRELCDVCTTTLFNCHYVCERCGFVVCIDCLQSRADNLKDHKIDDEVKKEIGDSGDNSHDVTDLPIVTSKKSKKDSFGWIYCAKNEEHSHNKLALAKIIAGDCLEEVWALLHKMRQHLNLKQCSCKNTSLSASHSWDISQKEIENSNVKLENEMEGEGSHSTLKGLLLASNTVNGSTSPNDFVNDEDSQDDSEQVSAAIEGCIASLNIEEHESLQDEFPKAQLPDILSNTHLRLCNGDLLVLTHSRHQHNTRLFRGHWKQGKPVLVRDIHKRMNIDMWLPQFFSGKFGDYRSDLVDCRNGDIHRQSMRKYWDGFEPNPAKKRPKEDSIPGHIPSASNEEPSAVSTSYYSGSALWRLKDWPPGQDFKEILPEHYEDFMNNLPLSSYTTRTGRLNLACRLPKEMVKPDLGPKMYSAYGTNKFPERGTTNLHLDISDAVNVMVYVGGANPYNQGSAEYAEMFQRTVEDCHVDELMKAQIRDQKLIPGALWHIFKPSDVNKMREFLNKVSDECKISPEKRNDPIHDQIWYLDQPLLDRLYKEYGVKSYPILQCMGDAILIPAGAPHQVKNLQNCIKVANDFVSPENVRYCLQLTNEFRNLPETHINQEDKLQIKNILYHSVKESIQYIDLYESGKVSASDEPLDEDDC